MILPTKVLLHDRCFAHKHSWKISRIAMRTETTFPSTFYHLILRPIEITAYILPPMSNYCISAAQSLRYQTIPATEDIQIDA